MSDEAEHATQPPVAPKVCGTGHYERECAYTVQILSRQLIHAIESLSDV
jgi:hypothetical protein